MPAAVNVCRFVGRLTEFAASHVGEDKLLLGKGKLLLPDSEKKNLGQAIKIIAWGEVAARLSQVELGQWIGVLTVYTPSVFKGYLNDTFTVDCLKVIDVG